MKKTLILVTIIISLNLTYSCSSNNESLESNIPLKNIKFEVYSSRDSESSAYITINNETEKSEIRSLSYKKDYMDYPLEERSDLKLVFVDESNKSEIHNNLNWTDYKVELKITSDYKVLTSQIFLITKTTEFVQISVSL